MYETGRGIVMVSALAILAGISCSGSATTARGSIEPAVQLLSSLRLLESDSLYIGRPSALEIDPHDGSLYVADRFFNRAIQFDSAGRPIRVFGKQGEGPGELKNIGPLFVYGSELIIADTGRQLLNRYRKSDGAFTGSVHYDGRLTSGTVADDRVLLGALDWNTGFGVTTWDVPSNSFSNVAPIPREYMEIQPLAQIYSGVYAVGWRDTTLVGFMGMGHLLVLGSDGAVLDTVLIPRRQRRGALRDPYELERLAKSFEKMFSAQSALFRLHRLPSGSSALVHFDQEIDGNLITARVFLSLLAENLYDTCTDREIPVAQTGQPLIGFRGNTLFVLDQHIEGEQAHTLVNSYLIDEEPCFGKAGTAPAPTPAGY